MIGRDKKDHLTLEEAQFRILEKINPVKEMESVPLLESVGRILAGDVRADINNPPFNRAPVDGYAVRSKDIAGASRDMPVRLSVVAEINAGGHYDKEVLSGQAVRIMTGAPVPEGCDACVRQESTDYGETAVEIYESCPPYTNYCYAGEDFRAGQPMLTDGTKLGYVEIGVLASMGCDKVSVYQKPGIALFTTGDELVFPGDTLGPGKLYNSNLFGLAARMQELGSEPFICAHLADDPKLAADRIRDVAGKCSLIITTGGVSVGKKDIIHDVIELLGAKRQFWGIDIKPGMPTVFSIVEDVPVISLTGNPFGAMTNFDLLIRPVLAKLCRDQTLLPVRTTGIMKGSFEKTGQVRRFVRAIYDRGAVTLPEGSHSSGVLASMQGCNCLVDIPGGFGALRPGKQVRVLLTGTGMDGKMADCADGKTMDCTDGKTGLYADAAKIPPMFGICGIKNSGKTTLIERLLPVFARWGLKVAVIKHDGHDFEADVPGTDSYRFFNGGAAASAVYSDSKWSVVSRQDRTDLEAACLPVTALELARLFPWAGLILCEGLKGWDIPKLEVVRRENSKMPVCTPDQVCFYVSDMKAPAETSGNPASGNNEEIYPFEDIERIAAAIIRRCGIEM